MLTRAPNDRASPSVIIARVGMCASDEAHAHASGEAIRLKVSYGARMGMAPAPVAR
jgi:hypothetical protein